MDRTDLMASDLPIFLFNVIGRRPLPCFIPRMRWDDTSPTAPLLAAREPRWHYWAAGIVSFLVALIITVLAQALMQPRAASNAELRPPPPADRRQR